MSTTNFHFLALFETPAHDGESFELVFKPVKIAFFRAERVFKVFGQFTKVFAAARSGSQPLLSSVEIKTSADRFHIAIQVRVQADQTQHEDILKKADELIDTTIAKLAALYGDEMFMNQIYRGPVEHPGGGIAVPFAGKVAAETVAMQAADVAKAMGEIDSHVARSSVSQQRLRLAARFYAKSLLTLALEEQFLLTWTVLEVFPMMNTTNVAPLKRWLSERTARPVEEIERKLEVGRLHGYRSDLVHNGVLPGGAIQHEILHKVYVMATEVIHHLCGRPYTGRTGMDKLLAGP